LSAKPHPGRDELLAMAYADGELSGTEREAFAARLAHEPELAREVVRHHKLAVLARRLAPPEPMDHEWRRLERSRVQRAGRLGLWMLAAGLAGLAALGVFALLADPDTSLAVKVLVGVAALGLALALGAAFHARMRTRPYDPYTEVER
jgi:anti-sigma factor RsiW